MDMGLLSLGRAVVPRAEALGWRKTHFGHPDGHVRQALGLGLSG